ncbi:hypothetical protein F183_A41230 [Bryobacterales bacterium F-183]|nr:hypothetical protein F183_A41230 [Bryobacterales bacterium F-183]
MSDIIFSWAPPAAAKSFRTGVSLHSHTNLSEESLDIIPRYTANVPYLGSEIRKLERRFQECTGRPLDFARAFWTPPLSPRQAYDLEWKQIAHDLGLFPLVSLTDHDNVQAGYQLRVLNLDVPVSTEWSVPFGPTFFHVGVHNLKPSRGHQIMGMLSQVGGKHSALELLAFLNEDPEVLVVLNHPFWDEAGAGHTEHANLLGAFLERHGAYIHALELNGLRPWQENRKVAWLARHTGHPVISGGDRHGCEPNSLLNLTNATSFSEFAAEVRYAQRSTVLFQPQHREPIKYRTLQTMWHIMREYPENAPGRRHWADRVFFRDLETSHAHPLSYYFRNGEPALIRRFSAALRIVESRRVRGLLRYALDSQEQAQI